MGGQGSLAYFAMGTMGLIYLLALLATGRSLNRMLSQSLELQFEKSDLVDTLTAAQKQAEAANVAKSEFLAMISHELRTPLNAVLGFSQLLADQVHGRLGHQRYQDYVQHIAGSGRHLMHLIEDLLALSKAGAGNLSISEERIEDLPSFLRQCMALVEIRAAEKRLGLDLKSGDLDAVLWADPVRLRQIIINVLSNAIKFTPKGGEITLSVERGEAGSLCLVVSDTGIGMSEGELKVALESFGRADTSHTRDTEGAGVGLPLTESLMKLHQGEVEIASRPGGGTRVTLRFPATRVIDSAEDQPGAAQTGNTSSAA